MPHLTGYLTRLLGSPQGCPRSWPQIKGGGSKPQGGRPVVWVLCGPADLGSAHPLGLARVCRAFDDIHEITPQALGREGKPAVSCKQSGSL